MSCYFSHSLHHQNVIFRVKKIDNIFQGSCFNHEQRIYLDFISPKTEKSHKTKSVNKNVCVRKNTGTRVQIDIPISASKCDMLLPSDDGYEADSPVIPVVSQV